MPYHALLYLGERVRVTVEAATKEFMAGHAARLNIYHSNAALSERRNVIFIFTPTLMRQEVGLRVEGRFPVCVDARVGAVGAQRRATPFYLPLMAQHDPLTEPPTLALAA